MLIDSNYYEGTGDEIASRYYSLAGSMHDLTLAGLEGVVGVGIFNAGRRLYETAAGQELNIGITNLNLGKFAPELLGTNVIPELGIGRWALANLGGLLDYSINDKLAGIFNTERLNAADNTFATRTRSEYFERFTKSARETAFVGRNTISNLYTGALQKLSAGGPIKQLIGKLFSISHPLFDANSPSNFLGVEDISLQSPDTYFAHAKTGSLVMDDILGSLNIFSRKTTGIWSPIIKDLKENSWKVFREASFGSKLAYGSLLGGGALLVGDAVSSLASFGLGMVPGLSYIINGGLAVGATYAATALQGGAFENWQYLLQNSGFLKPSLMRPIKKNIIPGLIEGFTPKNVKKLDSKIMSSLIHSEMFNHLLFNQGGALLLGAFASDKLGDLGVDHPLLRTATAVYGMQKFMLGTHGINSIASLVEKRGVLGESASLMAASIFADPLFGVMYAGRKHIAHFIQTLPSILGLKALAPAWEAYAGNTEDIIKLMLAGNVAGNMIPELVGPMAHLAIPFMSLKLFQHYKGPGSSLLPIFFNSLLYKPVEISNNIFEEGLRLGLGTFGIASGAKILSSLQKGAQMGPAGAMLGIMMGSFGVNQFRSTVTGSALWDIGSLGLATWYAKDLLQEFVPASRDLVAAFKQESTGKFGTLLDDALGHTNGTMFTRFATMAKDFWNNKSGLGALYNQYAPEIKGMARSFEEFLEGSFLGALKQDGTIIKAAQLLERYAPGATEGLGKGVNGAFSKLYDSSRELTGLSHTGLTAARFTMGAIGLGYIAKRAIPSLHTLPYDLWDIGQAGAELMISNALFNATGGVPGLPFGRALGYYSMYAAGRNLWEVAERKIFAVAPTVLLPFYKQEYTKQQYQDPRGRALNLVKAVALASAPVAVMHNLMTAEGERRLDNILAGATRGIFTDEDAIFRGLGIAKAGAEVGEAVADLGKVINNMLSGNVVPNLGHWFEKGVEAGTTTTETIRNSASNMATKAADAVDDVVITAQNKLARETRSIESRAGQARRVKSLGKGIAIAAGLTIGYNIVKNLANEATDPTVEESPLNAGAPLAHFGSNLVNSIPIHLGNVISSTVGYGLNVTKNVGLTGMSAIMAGVSWSVSSRIAKYTELNKAQLTGLRYGGGVMSAAFTWLALSTATHAVKSVVSPVTSRIGALHDQSVVVIPGVKPAPNMTRRDVVLRIETDLDSKPSAERKKLERDFGRLLSSEVRFDNWRNNWLPR